MIAYKLFRILKTKPGLYPLFIGKTEQTIMDEWIEAEYIPTKGFAHRPGWHCGVLPIAPHLRNKQGFKQPCRVWCEVDVKGTNSWQGMADMSKTGDIRDRIPKDGFYEFKTNKMQGGAWIIAGSIKVNKILTSEEITKILKGAGIKQNEIERELT